MLQKLGCNTIMYARYTHSLIQASLRRVATKELLKYSNSFTSLDSSLLFYALVFFDEGKEAEVSAKTKEGASSGVLETSKDCDGFLSMKIVGESSSSCSMASSSAATSTSSDPASSPNEVPPGHAAATPGYAAAAVSSIRKSIADRIPASFSLPASLPHPSSLLSSISASARISSISAGISAGFSSQNNSEWIRTYFIMKDGSFIKFDSESQTWMPLFEKR